MQTAFMIATGRCTRGCPFCFYSTGYLGRPREEAGTDRLLGAVEALAGLGVERIVVTGGEPLVRPDIWRILARAGERGMARLLLTNADLLDRAAVRRLLDAGVEAVSVSVNELATLAKREEAIAALARGGAASVTAIVAFHGENIREIPAILSWAWRSGVTPLLQPAFIPAGSKWEKALSPRSFGEAEWRAVEPFFRAWAEDAGAGPYAGLVLGLYGRGAPLRPRSCAMGGSALVVDCDLTVYPCFHRRDLAAGILSSRNAQEIRAALAEACGEVSGASCFGEHCVSLFAGVREIDLADAT